MSNVAALLVSPGSPFFVTTMPTMRESMNVTSVERSQQVHRAQARHSTQPARAPRRQIPLDPSLIESPSSTRCSSIQRPSAPSMLSAVNGVYSRAANHAA